MLSPVSYKRRVCDVGMLSTWLLVRNSYISKLCCLWFVIISGRFQPFLATRHVLHPPLLSPLPFELSLSLPLPSLSPPLSLPSLSGLSYPGGYFPTDYLNCAKHGYLKFCFTWPSKKKNLSIGWECSRVFPEIVYMMIAHLLPTPSWPPLFGVKPRR